MAKKKPWLKTRLQQLGKSAAGLARHLGIAEPRVYEVGGGRRRLQPDEITPTAQYLEWTVEELIQRLPPEERILMLPRKPTLAAGTPATIVAAADTATTATVAGNDIPLLDPGGDVKANLSCGIDERNDLFAVYISGKQMMPWRKDGQLVLGEKHRPPAELDHVVIFMTVNKQKIYRVVQLLHSDDPNTIIVRQHNPDNGPEPIERRRISAMHRIICWDDVIYPRDRSTE